MNKTWARELRRQARESCDPKVRGYTQAAPGQPIRAKPKSYRAEYRRLKRKYKETVR